MQNGLKDIIKRVPCEIGYIITAEDGSVIDSFQEDKQFPSASIIKLNILWAIYKKINDGYLKSNDMIKVSNEKIVGGCGILQHIYSDSLELSIRDLAILMIDLSDNIATNLILEIAGIDYINKEIERLGFKETSLQRKLMDSEAVKLGLDNYTSPRDSKGILNEILNSSEIREDLRKEMEEILKIQILNQYTPQYLPSDYAFAHKTGNLARTLHDAGVLYTPNGKYYISVLVHELDDLVEGVRLHNEIGEYIFKHIRQLESK